MKLSWGKALGGFFLAALLSAPVFGANPALPGTLNFVEGQASIQNQPITSKSVGTADLAAGQTISTQNGRAEVLLTPGVFLRLAHNSSVTMVSPDITNTKVRLDKGSAEVEVAEIYKQNDLQVQQGDATTRMLKKGVYEFSAPQDQVRVFKGEAQVNDGDKNVKVKAGHELTLDAPKLKTAKFNEKQDENGLYNWSELRDEYLSDASANAATLYVGNSWIGPGWYWDPWYYDYTFIPGAGMLYSPFGPWGFYSPGFVYSYGPYLGYGYYGAPLYYHGGVPVRGIPPRAHSLTHAEMPHPVPHVGAFRGARAFSGPAFPHSAPPTVFRGGMASGFHGMPSGGFHGGGFRR